MSSEHEKKQVEVLRLIQAYRYARPHQAASSTRWGCGSVLRPVDLSINHYGLTNADLDTTFRAGDLFIGKEEASLREIFDALQETYCRTIGAGFTHIVDSESAAGSSSVWKACGRPELSADSRAPCSSA